MTLYNKVNKFIGKHSYLPDRMSCDRTAGISICYAERSVGDECDVFYNHIKMSINNKPELWNHADIKITSRFNGFVHGFNTVITIWANSGRLN